MSRFASIQVAPPIEVFNVNKMAVDDPHPQKINLSIGAYRTDEGKPWVLPVVRDAEKKLAADDTLIHEYLPQLGFEPFTKAATALLLGSDHSAIKEGRAFGVQSLSGTGALRNGGDFLAKILGYKSIAVSKPTWGNHNLIFRDAGFTDIKPYRYWDAANKCLDLAGMLADFESFAENTVVVLHACAHNPTGMDPTHDEWKQISDVILRKRLFPFFDSAYQGFASGNPDQDAWAVRHFAASGHELVTAQSFAKNFGLYNERVGNLTVVTTDPATIPAFKSQIALIVRANYSNPPAHGCKVVQMVLEDPALKANWFENIKTMSGRIIDMRSRLHAALTAQGTPGNWDHITKQIGMFSFTGLTEEQCLKLQSQYHVYLLKNGRVSMCGLTTHNVDYFAKAVHAVVTGS